MDNRFVFPVTSSLGHFLKSKSDALFPRPSGTQFIAHNGYEAELQLPLDETLAGHLAISFAPNLLADSELKIWIGEHLLDPIPNIAGDKKEEMAPNFPGSCVRTVVWKKGQAQEMHWCDTNFISRRHEDIDLDVQVPFQGRYLCCCDEHLPSPSPTIRSLLGILLVSPDPGQ